MFDVRSGPLHMLRPVLRRERIRLESIRAAALRALFHGRRSARIREVQE